MNELQHVAVAAVPLRGCLPWSDHRDPKHALPGAKSKISREKESENENKETKQRLQAVRNMFKNNLRDCSVTECY